MPLKPLGSHGGIFPIEDIVPNTLLAARPQPSQHAPHSAPLMMPTCGPPLVLSTGVQGSTCAQPGRAP